VDDVDRTTSSTLSEYPGFWAQRSPPLVRGVDGRGSRASRGASAARSAARRP